MVRAVAALIRRIKRERSRRVASQPSERPINLSLLDWTRHYLAPTQTAPSSPFHRWLTKELDDLRTSRESRLNVLAPRRSAKSTIASLAYPLREALEGREPFTVIISDTRPQAIKLFRQIRDALDSNEMIIADYPESAGKGKLWREDHIQLRNGCEIFALGTGGKIRGVKSAANFRPSMIICDDLQRIEHVSSPLQRERSMEWFNKDLMSAGAPGANILVLGTPLHREDIVCTLERTPPWRTHKWRSIVKWPERMDMWMDWRSRLAYTDESQMASTADADAFLAEHHAEMHIGAEVLWPEYENLAALMLHRASIGDNAFEAEKQCNPVSHELLEWPDEYFTHGAFWFNEWPQDLTIKVIACDPSKGAHDNQGDPSSIIRYGRSRDGTEYIEADIKRRNVEAICRDIARHQQEFNADGIAMETNGFQELLLIPLRQSAQQIHLDVLPIYKYDNTVPKPVRIRRLTAPLAARKMRFKTRSPGTVELVKQMRDWPTGLDDGPDSLELARRLAVELFNGKARR